MHGSIKAALLLTIGSFLAACAGHAGTAMVPQISGTGIDTESTAILRAGATYAYQVNPFVRRFAVDAKARPHMPPPSFCVENYGFACYTPAEMRTAYDMPAALTGSGQTIVIVDAFGSPTIQDDLRTFDAIMNLPDPSFRIFYPQGPPSSLRSEWATETSLDVEWAHAIAPGAQIDLVVAPTNQSADMHAALAYAVDNQLGSIVSMSFGEPEPAIPGGKHNAFLQHADSVFQRAKSLNITLIASTGDTGATNGANGAPEAVFPASDPLVTSVGGTSLYISDTGAYERETVWNDSIASLCPFNCLAGVVPYATGGAPSAVFKTPSFQHNLVDASTREVADVSYNAGIYTAVLTYMSFNGPGAAGLYFTGGTSCGAPQWAGIVALANQAAGRHLGYINQRLYIIAKGASYHLAFHDVTVGNDGFFGDASEPARPGYDMPTGLGSPNVANLIPALIRAQEQD